MRVIVFAIQQPLLLLLASLLSAVPPAHAIHDNSKHFHESFHQHYDGRFATAPLAPAERQQHLTALVQHYLTTMASQIREETWLMHGTLLGWYWNRRVLPWDSDVDAMVSEPAMRRLAAAYNMTIYRFPGPPAREYLLEVNPNFADGEVGSNNTIDARFIDTAIGLYIDITTLRRNYSAEALGQEGVMMVKDRHKYQYDDIFPLRESTFEDTRALVPFAYPDVLVEEYGPGALSTAVFQSHRFDPEREEWVPTTTRKLLDRVIIV